MMDSWTRLSLYESTDLVRQLFQKRHNRELNLTKAREIVSAFAQGREYFVAASEAGLLVRPLLQYYGVLALSRGLILFLSRNREATLPPSHGLSCLKWNDVLAGDSPNPGNLQIEVNSQGTFISLLESTNNADWSVVFATPYPAKMMFYHPRIITDLPKTTFTFKEVVGRISELRYFYEQSFSERPSNFEATVFALSQSTQTNEAPGFTMSPSTQTKIDLFWSRYGLPTLEQLRTDLSIPDDVTLERKAQHQWLPTYRHHLSYSLLHPEGFDFKMMPQIENVTDGSMSIIVPFSKGLTISRIGRFFLMSYYLGMLARYHPTSWFAIMQSRQKGDFLLPLIREAVNAIQLHFPFFIIEEIEPSGWPKM